MSEGQQAKFVTVNSNIYFSDATESMDMAMERHSTLAERAGAYSPPFDKPIVDDGGIFEVVEGKIRFKDITGSCTIKDPQKAREITSSVAKKILGEDRVA